MIERKIDKKKSKKSYLPILIILLALTALVYLISNYWAKVDPPVVKETPSPKENPTTATTSTTFKDVEIPALKRFRQFVAKSSKYQDPSPLKFAKQGTVLMSEALIAMVERYDIDDMGMERGRDMLKDRTTDLKTANGKNLINRLRDSLEGNIDMLKGLMKRNTPNIEHDNASLIESGFKITANLEKLSNEEFYQFLKSVQSVMYKMSMKMEERRR